MAQIKMTCPVDGCSRGLYSNGFGLIMHIDQHVEKGHIDSKTRDSIFNTLSLREQQKVERYNKRDSNNESLPNMF